MSRSLMRVLRGAVALLLILPSRAPAQVATIADSAAVAEMRQAIRAYDAALRRGDIESIEQFWAPDYIFINPRGERLTRSDRQANARERRTTFDSLAPVLEEEQIRAYGDMAVHTTLLTIEGRYSGRPERGQFRALVVWVRRDGRWQQLASQLTPVQVP